MNTAGTRYGSIDTSALEARVAARIAARLTEHAQALPPDISERLRFAREQALARARTARGEAAAPAVRAAAAAGSRATSPWWWRLAGALPLVALVGGLMLIQDHNVDAQLSAAAAIDTALLADELPPAAYADAGFVEFLKGPARD